jgi:hypothetical protein
MRGITYLLAVVVALAGVLVQIAHASGYAEADPIFGNVSTACPSV